MPETVRCRSTTVKRAVGSSSGKSLSQRPLRGLHSTTVKEFVFLQDLATAMEFVFLQGDLRPQTRYERWSPVASTGGRNPALKGLWPRGTGRGTTYSDLRDS